MMAQYVNVRSDLFRHRKTKRLAELLNLNTNETAAVILRLLFVCGEMRQQFLLGADAASLATECQYEGDPKILLKSLVDSGWVIATEKGIGVPEFIDNNRWMMSAQSQPENFPIPDTMPWQGLETVEDLGAFWSFHQTRRFKDSPQDATANFRAMVASGAWSISQIRDDLRSPTMDWSDSFGAWKVKAERRRDSKLKKPRFETAEERAQKIEKMGW